MILVLLREQLERVLLVNISMKSSHGAGYPGCQALTEISTTSCSHLIGESNHKTLKLFPGIWAGQGHWGEKTQGRARMKVKGLPHSLYGVPQQWAWTLKYIPISKPSIPPIAESKDPS